MLFTPRHQLILMLLCSATCFSMHVAHKEENAQQENVQQEEDAPCIWHLCKPPKKRAQARQKNVRLAASKQAPKKPRSAQDTLITNSLCSTLPQVLIDLICDYARIAVPAFLPIMKETDTPQFTRSAPEIAPVFCYLIRLPCLSDAPLIHTIYLNPERLLITPTEEEYQATYELVTKQCGPLKIGNEFNSTASTYRLFTQLLNMQAQKVPLVSDEYREATTLSRVILHETIETQAQLAASITALYNHTVKHGDNILKEEYVSPTTIEQRISLFTKAYKDNKATIQMLQETADGVSSVVFIEK